MVLKSEKTFLQEISIQHQRRYNRIHTIYSDVKTEQPQNIVFFWEKNLAFYLQI